MSEEQDHGYRFAVLTLVEEKGDPGFRYERHSVLITDNQEGRDVVFELQRRGYPYAALYRGNLTLEDACALAAELHRSWIASELDDDDKSEAG